MDDELVFPASSCSSPSSATFFSTADDHLMDLEFVSYDVAPWMWGDDHWLGVDEHFLDGAAAAGWGDEDSRSAGTDDLPGDGEPPPAPAPKRRGRRPGPRTNGPTLTHVEAEKQRRDKLNRRFCELRAAVPTVSRMDKASLLADAAAYIAELRDRVERLEAEAEARERQASATATAAAVTTAASAAHSFGSLEEKLEVRMMLGREAAAALRLTSAARHAPARLMVALRSLDLPVQHASVCRVGGVTVQDAVVDLPAAALRNEGRLRAELLHRLQRSG